MPEVVKCARCGHAMTESDGFYEDVCDDCGDEIDTAEDYCDTCGDMIEGTSYGGQCTDCSDSDAYED